MRHFRFFLVFALCGSAIAGPENLLTGNPGFEVTPEGFSFPHGTYKIPGWDGANNFYNTHYLTAGSSADGNTTEGRHAFHFDWEGTLSTAGENRPPAVPGAVYEVSFDLRTLVGNFPEDRLGTFAFLEFFDEAGNRLKVVWGPDWRPQVQANGVAPWENIVVRGVAPEGSARVGVRVQAPGGVFHSEAYNRSQNRHIELDNFRLQKIPETRDQLAVRRLPRLVEPGVPAVLRIHSAAVAPRTLVARLRDASGTVRAEASLAVPAGRGLRTLAVPVPDALPDGIYSWDLGLTSPTGTTAQRKEAGVIVDQTVAGPDTGSGDFRANHPKVLYMGRIEELPNGSRWWHWFGSEVRLRFRGTSLALLGAASDNGFGGFDPSVLQVVVDGDFENPLTVALPQNGADFVLPLVSGLPEGIHTVTLFKKEESNLRVRFDGFRVSEGGGLLRPEPLSQRRIEIYGDSVTSGGEASPNCFGYAPLLGRELDADIRIISKGGTGVAASFGGQSTLREYWNNLTFPNVFHAAGGKKADLTDWVPGVVLCTIGHNDQFNDGGPVFGKRYAEFHQALRAAYPNVPLIAGNTTISAPIAHFQNAVDPLVAGDPRMHFVFQIHPSDNLLYNHPDRAGHHAMVHGDEKRFSYADVVEQQAGWGLDGFSPAHPTTIP